MTPITKINLNKEQKEVFSVWYDYLMGAISYNDASKWERLSNFNLDKTSRYFNNFNKVEIDEQAIESILEKTPYKIDYTHFKNVYLRESIGIIQFKIIV